MKKKFLTSNFPCKFLKNLQGKQSLTSTRGFTLIEILIVIAIIGILTSLLMANFAQVRSRARDSQRKSDLRQIQKALQMYYDDNKSYPTQAPGNGFLFGARFPSADTSSPYMSFVPKDPLSPNQDYIYYHDANSDTFRIESALENLSDKDIGSTQNRCGTPTPSPGKYVVCSD